MASKFPKSLLFWAMVPLLFLFLWQTLNGHPPPVDVSYTEFLGDIEAGKVTLIEVNERKTEALFSVKDADKNAPKHKVVLLNSDYVALAHKYHVPARGTPVSVDIFQFLMPLLMLAFMGFIIFTIIQARKGGAGGIEKFSKMRGGAVPLSTSKQVTFADVAGCDEAKADLMQTVEFLKNPGKFTRLGGKSPKGTLLVGPPGVGKTLLAKAVAGEANVPCFSLSASDFVEMFVGVGASRVRDLFDTARKSAPCVIFIDEFDAMGTRSSGATYGGGHSETDQTINAFLKEMDGFESVKGVIFLAATNRPEKLDAALLRPGRFDRRVVVHRPEIKGREAILRIHSRNKPLAEDVDLKKLAASTAMASGADLENIMNEAALHAAESDKPAVDTESINFAKDKVAMGAERKSLIMSEASKKNTAYHEGGHAIVAILTPGNEPVDRVSIIPRDKSLGVTMFTPSEDKHSYSKEYLNAELATMMGGRIGEEILSGPDGVTTGAGNDSERATERIWDMVCRWGMSELGLTTFAETEQSIYLGSSRQLRNCSEATKEKIDAERNRIFNERYAYAKNLLFSNKEALHATANALLIKETLTGEEIKAIIAKHPPKPPNI
ncbi:MAG: ATP-dependent zinc metalloprotease FtsH [Candidatus Liptonbacteria bacterium]|nr:ATP-dependent zinc metalloprotease FtsH [Candidatus Liptonbacteria bacterium]